MSKSTTYLVLNKTVLTIFLITGYLLISAIGIAQISPGDLAEVHSHLEGMSNCTKCHTLGKKVSNDKCLDCHKWLNSQIKEGKGYHASNVVKGNSCTKCHSDHHGRKFQMIRFDQENFDHSLTGYLLSGAHKQQECRNCHKKEFINNKEIKKKKSTFLGLNQDCLSCHDDYHQKTLPADCKKCHDFNKFKPAPNFDHNNAKFKLSGKHQTVECNQCHKITSINGKELQKFAGLQFGSCANCHKDVHDNKFGKDCTQCHTEQSFQLVKGVDNFDHSKTTFGLEGLHKTLKCKDCHKGKLTDPIIHNKCSDCHKDYHERQFEKSDKSPDCSDCHTNKGFSGSSFTIERHKKTEFPLNGAHMATPCFVCHKKDEKWNFRKIGKYCVDCHTNIHNTFIDIKYYPESNCSACHTETKWSAVSFDHTKTGYKLLGKHKEQSCRACHFKLLPNGKYRQEFAELNSSCTQCHKDEHYKQFEKDGQTNCFRCHDYNDWKAGKFDHSKTRFALEGKHKSLSCDKCHKKEQIDDITYTIYKLNKFKCEDCH